MAGAAKAGQTKTPDPAFWAGRNVLLTGHTGFIGGWTSRWLSRLGARVTGLSLPPDTTPSLFEAASIESIVESRLGDIRRPDNLRTAIEAARPNVVLHLAAQPLVRRAFRQPVDTIETNVMGTVHLLEACRALDPTPAIVAFTTDKVYDNEDAGRPFTERDPLGGKEPYGAGKAAADILARAYRESYFGGRNVACVRAGNVIGGGDWAEDRLLPDAMRAFTKGAPLILRNPDAVRPWQHVLEPVRGILILAERLAAGASGAADSFNFGPDPEGQSSVGDVARRAAELWGPKAVVESQSDENAPYEARLLTLSSEGAGDVLDWRPVVPLPQALELTIDWYRAFADGEDMGAYTDRQIAAAYGSTFERETDSDAARIA